MPDLIAISYPEDTTAGQAAEELERRADDLPIDPDAMGVVVCERDWTCQLITRRHPGATAAWSRFWGAFLGVVMGQCEINGIDSAFREQIKALAKPGTSILFIVSGMQGTARATEALSQYGGAVLTCSLAKDAVAELRDALDGENDFTRFA